MHRVGRPLFDRQSAYGSGVPGGRDGAAVLDGRRVAGQLLVVEPVFAAAPPATRLLGETAALTPLAGPAVLVTAVAPDTRPLRRVLDRALDEPADALVE
ncbi:hypothetical protein ACFXPV_26680 [Streptomyces sp. NPDC059118]|uniref:hypothetical protein n=1 Tax=unclassified Streptomyces TaxID=2593676 RepID=UPI0036916367